MLLWSFSESSNVNKPLHLSTKDPTAPAIPSTDPLCAHIEPLNFANVTIATKFTVVVVSEYWLSK